MAPNEYLDELTLKEKIEKFSEEGKFLAEQQFRMAKQFDSLRKHMDEIEERLDERTKKVEKKCEDCAGDNKQKWFNGAGITALITAIGAMLTMWLKGE